MTAVCLVTAHGAGLDREAAARCVSDATQRHLESLKAGRTEEIEARSITIGSHQLRWLESSHGTPGEAGHSLWISLHGGGEVPQIVNDEQWRKQASLYCPPSGIYLAPRAPTDTWFLWNEPQVDPLLERLIEGMVAVRGVDPERVYLLGYSAGGNGVYHLAPRMADRFAAAATMAGYPSGAAPASLRNLPFAIFVGEHDTTFGRVKEAEDWRARLVERRGHDPSGYLHWVSIYPGLGHWMQGRDAEALPWMARFTRNSWPRKVVWMQDEVPHSRFYWLEMPATCAKAGRSLTATVTGQTIALDGDCPPRMTLWLSDALLDLGKPVTVTCRGVPIHHAEVPRSEESIEASLGGRFDPAACATARLDLDLAPLSATSPPPP